MVFPVVMYGCESWTIKKTAKELMPSNCGAGEDSWESLGLQGDQTSPSWDQISPEYSLEGLMLKLKLQYFSHLMWRGNSLEKTLMLGNIEGRRRRRWQRMRWLNGITDSMDLGLSKLWEMVKDRETFHTTVCGLQRVRHDWETEQQLMLSQWFNILWWAVLSQYY